MPHDGENTNIKIWRKSEKNNIKHQTKCKLPISYISKDTPVFLKKSVTDTLGGKKAFRIFPFTFIRFGKFRLKASVCIEIIQN